MRETYVNSIKLIIFIALCYSIKICVCFDMEFVSYYSINKTYLYSAIFFEIAQSSVLHMRASGHDNNNKVICFNRIYFLTFWIGSML